MQNGVGVLPVQRFEHRLEPTFALGFHSRDDTVDFTVVEFHHLGEGNRIVGQRLREVRLDRVGLDVALAGDGSHIHPHPEQRQRLLGTGAL